MTVKWSNRLIVLLLLLQVDSALFLWSAAFLGSLSQSTIVFFLVVDLIGFAMISYAFRVGKYGEDPGRLWIGMGCCALAGILFSSLLFQ